VYESAIAIGHGRRRLDDEPGDDDATDRNVRGILDHCVRPYEPHERGR
jgi:hypothetical protein